MSKKDVGGLVYPGEQGQLPDGSWNQTYEAGMTRRDWLAGLAMQGIVTNEEARQQSIRTAEKFNKTVPEIIAHIAYETADAMIAESNK